MKWKSYKISFLVILMVITACSPSNTDQILSSKQKEEKGIPMNNLKTIYFAGGCFWGVEAYFSRIKGVVDATSGYANGMGENPTYEDVIQGTRSFAETVEVKYDSQTVSLSELLTYYFKIVDPTSINKQGNDVGIQYRTGIYYVNKNDESTILTAIENEQTKYAEEIIVEVMPIQNFFLAEEYHQDYLAKNPNGYCHIDLSILDKD